MKKLYACDMELIINRKRIKNIYIRIVDGKIVVSCPPKMPEEEIVNLVNSREGAVKRMAEKAKNKENAFCDGGRVYLFGKEYVLRLNTQRKCGYYFEGSDLVLCTERAESEAVKRSLSDLYRTALEQILPDITRKCQESCGLYADEWKIRDMKTRWGSCNVKEKRIWLSVWLAAKPIECIEATVFHELAHLRVKGHGKEFYKLLLEICPNYKYAERLLKNK